MSWFDTIEDNYSTIGIKLLISQAVGHFQDSEVTTEDKVAIGRSSNILLSDMMGFNLETNERSDQEIWYNTWAASNSFNSELSLAMVGAETKFASQKEKFNKLHDSLNRIVDFILIRYFGNPIPGSYWNSTTLTPQKPRIVISNDLRYTPVLESLYNFLHFGGTGIKGLGNNTLAQMCQSFTRDKISKIPNIRKWCGCFSPDDPIAIQAKIRYPEQASYTKACDPICVHLSSIKLVDPDNNYDEQQCNSQLCILTKVAITTSEYDGTIKLNQTCPCSRDDGPCFCIIDSTVEDLLNKTTAPNGDSMSEPVTFAQYCPGARCMVEDEETKELTEVECENDNPNHTSVIHTERKKNGGKRPSTEIFIFIGLATSIIILFILCVRHIRFEPKFEVKNIVKQSNNISKYTRTTELGYLNRR